MVRAGILLAAFLLDWIVGDPYSLPHPIRWIGSLIAALERFLRGFFRGSARMERIGGGVMVLLVLAISVGTTVASLLLLGKLNAWAQIAFSVVLGCYMLAARSLCRESRRVQTALENGTLEEARCAVSMIVGRDTKCLDRAGVARAAVETVAENASDGVIAPLLYMALFGVAGGVAYKAINTMDSMVGYHNDKYENWGFVAAKLDDIVNFIPSRASGVLMCVAAALIGQDSRQAWKIYRRDRLNHKSPNSAQTEAACAGALHLQLGGSNYYFGKLVVKPTIGDDLRPVEAQDITRAGRLMYAAAFLALVLCCAGLVVLGCRPSLLGATAPNPVFFFS